MKLVDSETNSSQIDDLKNILGREWCRSELDQYDQFRSTHSPNGYWCHRLPTTSPIIPLLYAYERGWQNAVQPAPIGYWYGDPIHYLQQLAASIAVFKDYWAALPNDAGQKNIEFKLKTPDQFNGFMFELLISIGYRFGDSETELDVIPLFLDPRSDIGKPDIVIKYSTGDVGVQCKAKNPFSAIEMPFDIFQYLFGCFLRLVQDSRTSYRLQLKVDKPFCLADADLVLDKIKTCIGHGIELTHYPTSFGVFKLSRLDVPIGGLSKKEILKLLQQQNGSLFVEVGGVGDRRNKFHRVGICSASSDSLPSVERYLIRVADNALKNAKRDLPLILAIHFYADIQWERLLANGTAAGSLDNKLNQILSRFPFVKGINISSNNQYYASTQEGAHYIKTQYLHHPNPYYAEPGHRIESAG